MRALAGLPPDGGVGERATRADSARLPHGARPSPGGDRPRTQQGSRTPGGRHRGGDWLV